MSTPFSRDRLWNFAHVFYVSIPRPDLRGFSFMVTFEHLLHAAFFVAALEPACIHTQTDRMFPESRTRGAFFYSQQNARTKFHGLTRKKNGVGFGRGIIFHRLTWTSLCMSANVRIFWGSLNKQNAPFIYGQVTPGIALFSADSYIDYMQSARETPNPWLKKRPILNLLWSHTRTINAAPYNRIYNPYHPTFNIHLYINI